MADFGLSGRSVFLTGAATGIGRATLDAFAAEGAKVVAVDIAIDVLDQHVAEAGLDGVSTVHADLSTADGVAAAIEAGRAALGADAPDILVNNVGAGRLNTFEAISDEDFHRTFELNFFSMVRISRAFVPAMYAAGKGAVVNVTSDLSRQAEDVIVDYAASKAAVASVAKSLARTYAPKVRVNNVAPGPIWTPFWSDENHGWLKDIEAAYDKKGQDAVQALIDDRGIPLGRMGEATEVANAILFLSSDLAGYTTGSTLGVDGGTVRATN
jgi:NAD(P)-dependent dehydrogenase (short-subunit alcohol dehydrogenase family)